MRSWEGFSIVPPHVEFDTAITLPAGVEVRHIGGCHAEDSTVVWVPDSGVILLGDSFYPPPYHLRRPGDGYDSDVINAVLRDYADAEWFVDSHDDPHPGSALEDLLNERAQ